MHYEGGEEARLGDRVRLGENDRGLVVFSLDAAEFSEAYPRREWKGLKRGILVEFEGLGLVHYVEPEEALVLEGRGEPENGQR